MLTPASHKGDSFHQLCELTCDWLDQIGILTQACSGATHCKLMGLFRQRLLIAGWGRPAWCCLTP